MSIANELNRITSAKGDIVTAIEAKGVDVPEGTTLDAMSELIDLIGRAGHFKNRKCYMRRADMSGCIL